MQHPRDPFSSDDSRDDAVGPGASGRGSDPPPAPLPRRTSPTGHQPGGPFSRPQSSPRPPDGPLPAPAAPPAPPETHHAEAGPEPAPEPGYLSFESQVLFESWEPPGDLADPMWDVPFRSPAPQAELARDPEYAGQPWAAGFAGEPPGSRWAPPRPAYRPPAEPWAGPRHARRRNRGPRWGGAILALTGAVALAGAVPLGILGVRTITTKPVPALTTAPLANGSQISTPASAPAGAPSQLSQGQTAVAPASSPASQSAGQTAAGTGAAAGATAATFAFTAGPGCRSLNGVITWPFRAPTGDGWHPAAAARSGPCGASFSYSLLANVRDDSGNWHDHYAWIFHTGKPVASCTLSFYIPPSAHATSTAFYWLSTGSENPENRMADFSVDQKASQGQWVTKGPFTFGGGTVLAEVTDRGVGPVADSVEAGVLKLRCV